MTEKPKPSSVASRPTLPSTTDAAFRLQDLYPDAAALFAHTHPTVGEIKQTCMVVLDASVLLYAYELKSESFEEIGKVYSRLRDEQRLIVPGQSAREFYKIRPSKVAGIVERIDAALNNIEKNPFSDKINLLENNQHYKDAKSKSAEIVNKAKELRISLTACKAELEASIGSDPVSILYRDLLTSSIVELEMKPDRRNEFLKELEWRNRMKIAPGYTDSDKEDGGSGDLLIWHTLLQEASKRKVDCIFVTEERKEDWWVKSKGSSFQPRPELIDEYRRVSEGKSLYLMPLSTALLHFSVNDNVVGEVIGIEESDRNFEKYLWNSVIYSSKRYQSEFTDLEVQRDAIAQEIDEVEVELNRTVRDLEYVGKFNQRLDSEMSADSRKKHKKEINMLNRRYLDMVARLNSLRARHAQIVVDLAAMEDLIFSENVKND